MSVQSEIAEAYERAAVDVQDRLPSLAEFYRSEAKIYWAGLACEPRRKEWE